MVPTCHKKPVATAENQLNTPEKLIFETIELISNENQKLVFKKVVKFINTSLYFGSSVQNASNSADIILHIIHINKNIVKTHAPIEIYLYHIFE